MYAKQLIMVELFDEISIRVNKSTYLKDPDSSVLGKSIVAEGINLLDKIGYEEFTFQKLGKTIGCAEASIYRYFESKQKFLLYLASWYWSWMEYRLVFAIANIKQPKLRLEKAIAMLTEEIKEDKNASGIDKVKLCKIVFTESSKSYLTKQVDIENKKGAYQAYKQLVARVSDLVLEVSPKYKYPNMLVSTVIEGAHLQHFFSQHLPRLTNIASKKNQYLTRFYIDIVLKTIKNKK